MFASGVELAYWSSVMIADHKQAACYHTTYRDTVGYRVGYGGLGPVSTYLALHSSPNRATEERDGQKAIWR